MLQLVDFCFSRPGYTLKLNFDVQVATRLAMYGENGIGKTTTLHLIAGLLSADSGDIMWQQQLLAELPYKDRPISLLSQTDAVFDHLSVRDNIALGKYSVPSCHRKMFWDGLDLLIDAFALAPYLECKVGNLSGGQKQRVALIRLISQRQKLWLMDEPFNGLDDAVKMTAYQVLIDWQIKTQATLIFTTHHQDEINQFATNSCHLEKINGLIEIHS